MHDFFFSFLYFTWEEIVYKGMDGWMERMKGNDRSTKLQVIKIPNSHST